MMEDEYEFTVPCDDLVVFESPISESRLLNIDANTEILDVCESSQNSGDQMEDCLEKEVVLDSDDEVGDLRGAGNSVNEGFPAMGRLFGRDATGLLRRRQFPAGSKLYCDYLLGKLQVTSSQSYLFHSPFNCDDFRGHKQLINAS